MQLFYNNTCLKKIKNERWAHVPKLKGYLMVSSFGRIKVLKITKKNIFHKKIYNRKAYIKKQTITPKGYLTCTVLGKHQKAHRLIAEGFIPNPYNKPQINHKNGVKNDNRLNNLEWATNGENVAHSYKKLNRCSPMLGMNDSKHPNSKRIAQYSLSGELIKIWDSSMQIQRTLKINRSNVCSCCNKRKYYYPNKKYKYTKTTAGGFKWSWAEKQNKRPVL